MFPSTCNVHVHGCRGERGVKRAEDQPGRVGGEGDCLKGRGCTVCECVWVAEWYLGGGACGRLRSMVAVSKSRCESEVL